jgi:micrococcal nuclease
MKIPSSLSSIWSGLTRIAIRKEPTLWDFGYSRTWAFVREVLDGDTLELTSGERIRLMGVDAPEMNVGKPAELAKDFLRQRVEGKTIIFDCAPYGDKYGRTLGYAMLDGENLNYTMVLNGLARITPYDHPLRNDFFKAEYYARAKGLGVWQDINSAYPPKMAPGQLPSLDESPGME